MLATYSHLRSLLAAPKPQFGLRFALLSALLSVNPAFSQAPSAPAQAVPAQTQSAAEFNKPLQRETQPDLAVDRDPIPSPDVVVPTTASTNAPSIPGPAGQIQKGQNGVYTLHEDVDEV